MKGAPSVIYGTNGMGGVIDFIPDVARIQDGFGGAVEGGANNTMRARANVARSSGPATWLISGAYDRSDGFEVPDDFGSTVNQTSGTRTNSDYERRNLFGYLSGETETFGQTALFYSFSDNERGLPPETGIEDADFERLDESRRQTIGLSNQFESVPVSVKLFYNRYDSELTVFTDNTYREVDEVVDARDYSYGASAYSSLALGEAHLLVMSASAVKDTYIGDGAFADFDEASLHTYFVAAEDHFRLGGFDVTVGAILSHFDPEDGDAINVLDPQLIVEYDVSDNLSLHASAAQRTRFPRLRELYDRRRGNPLLDEQSAINTQLGLAYRHTDTWISDLTFFHSDVDGLIERPDRDSSYENLPDTTVQGIEVATGGWLNERIYGRLGYTYLDAAEQAPTGGERQLRSRAEHSGYGEVRVRLPARVELAMNAVYSSGLHDLDGDDNYVGLPSYFVLHLKASVALTDGLEAYLSMDNLTDETYAHRLGFPQPGRSVRVGLTFDF
jgi:iron complex outermembrane receptor protein